MWQIHAFPGRRWEMVNRFVREPVDWSPQPFNSHLLGRFSRKHGNDLAKDSTLYYKHLGLCSTASFPVNSVKCGDCIYTHFPRAEFGQNYRGRLAGVRRDQSWTTTSGRSRWLMTTEGLGTNFSVFTLEKSARLCWSLGMERKG